MKRFCLLLFVFGAILLSLIAGLGFLMYQVEKAAYYRGLVLSEAENYVALGDSRSEQILDPAQLTGLRNRSISGSQLCISRVLLQDMVHANKGSGEKTILMEISPFQLRMARAHSLRDCDKQKAFFWILHPELERDAPFPGLYRAFVENQFPIQFMVLVRSLLLNRNYPFSLTGGFAVPREKGGYTDAELIAAAQQDAEQSKDFVLEDEDIARMNVFVETCFGRGWKLMIVTFPMLGWRPESSMMRRFVEDMSAYCRRKGVRYLNLSAMCRSADLWLDGGHVNRKGARLLCEAVRKELQSGRVPSSH